MFTDGGFDPKPQCVLTEVTDWFVDVLPVIDNIIGREQKLLAARCQDERPAAFAWRKNSVTWKWRSSRLIACEIVGWLTWKSAAVCV